MPNRILLCPICDAPLEGPDDIDLAEDSLLTCTGLQRHTLTYKDAVDQMAKRVEAEILSDLEGMGKKSGI
jgi:hypothetical protein